MDHRPRTPAAHAAAPERIAGRHAGLAHWNAGSRSAAQSNRRDGRSVSNRRDGRSVAKRCKLPRQAYRNGAHAAAPERSAGRHAGVAQSRPTLERQEPERSAKHRREGRTLLGQLRACAPRAKQLVCMYVCGAALSSSSSSSPPSAARAVAFWTDRPRSCLTRWTRISHGGELYC